MDAWLLQQFSSQVAVASPISANNPRKPKLALSDLPTGFREVPRPINSLIRGAIASTMQNHFSSNAIQIGDLTTYMNLDQWTLIIGFITPLDNQEAVHIFDLGLEQPAALETFATGIKKSNHFLGSVNIVEKKVVPALSNQVGQSSTGMTITANAKQISLFSEMVAFRRNNFGAMLIIGRLHDRIPATTTFKLAQKFDSNLLNF
ncbi:hypothetical protein [Acaryochloris sp. IP29b_bin.148]|uniref:hypothetical protein n=1 Tax=Acaryochloris sp. IP29b_bin.148 TaxID=2969218 RepID=UPI002633F359|nr:hypothetical protein [Acaryochloris sp. IP29b_bin.148]